MGISTLAILDRVKSSWQDETFLTRYSLSNFRRMQDWNEIWRHEGNETAKIQIGSSQAACQLDPPILEIDSAGSAFKVETAQEETGREE